MYPTFYSNPLQSYDRDYHGSEPERVEPLMRPCDKCGGEGVLYYNERGAEVSKVVYDKLPHDERFEDDCPHCDNGEVTIEDPELDEPEWFN